MFRSLSMIVVALLGLAASLLGQHTMGHAPPPKAAAPGGPGSGKNKRTILDKWNRMSPEEQQKALAKLPPDRRKKIEEQLNRYRNLTPEQRSRLQMFNQLPPEKQNQARRLWGQFGQMPAERQKLLTGEFEKLRSMPETDRRSRLNSDEFRNTYNAKEQNFLGGLSGLLSPTK